MIADMWQRLKDRFSATPAKRHGVRVARFLVLGGDGAKSFLGKSNCFHVAP